MFTMACWLVTGHALLPVIVLHAQSPLRARDTIQAGALPDGLAHITTDTGDFAPGHRDFARYATPLQCLAAARTELQYRRRTRAAQLSADSVRFVAPEGDTVPVPVTRVARACGARFLTPPAVASAAPAMLPELLTLAFFTQNDTVVARVIDRQLADAPTDSTRQAVRLTAVGAALQAEPARIRLADSLVDFVDAQYPHELVVRMAAHQLLLRDAERQFDRVRFRREVTRILSLAQGMTSADALRGGGGIVLDTYRSLMLLTFVEHPDSMRVIAHEGQQTFQRPVFTTWLMQRTFGHPTASPDSMFVWLAPSYSGAVIDGRRTFPLHAQHWFSADGDTVQPAPGAISLVIYPHYDCYHQNLAMKHYWEQCEQTFARLAQWQRQYKAAGLHSVVVLATTHNALYSGLQSPAAQAMHLARYVREFYHLPVPVAVQQGQFTQLPPLQYFFEQPSEFVTQYQQLTGSRPSSDLAMLTDRDGHLLYAGPANAALLDALLAQRVHAPAAAAPSLLSRP